MKEKYKPIIETNPYLKDPKTLECLIEEIPTPGPTKVLAAANLLNPVMVKEQ